jgi:sigma-B regulation protein RsbU (phosphoserine phosphatase)
MRRKGFLKKYFGKKLLFKIRTKLIVLSVGSVCVCLFASILVSVVSFVFVGGSGKARMRDGLERMTQEHLKSYVGVLGARSWRIIQEVRTELDFMSDIMQGALDRGDLAVKIGESIGDDPYFEKKFVYSDKLKMLYTKSSGSSAFFAPSSVLDKSGNLGPAAARHAVRTNLLDLIFPAFYHNGHKKDEISEIGPPGVSYKRFYPFVDVDATVNSPDVKPEDVFEGEYWSVMPGLVERWQALCDSKPSREELRRVITFVGPYAVDKAAEELVISALAPLWADDYTKFDGALCMDIELSEFEKIVTAPSAGIPGFSFIARQNGNIMIINEEGAKTLGLHSKQMETASQFESIAIDRNMRDSSQPGIAALPMPSDNEVSIREVTLTDAHSRGERWFIAMKRLSPVNFWSKERGFEQENWLVGYAVPRESIYGALDQAGRDFSLSMILNLVSQICLGAVSVLVITFGVVKLSKRMTSGISALVKAAGKIKGNNYNVTVHVDSNDEISGLGAVFNSMVAEINRHTQGLEKLVRERTAELEKVNAQIISLNNALKQDNVRLSAELDVARELQMMALPRQKELASVSGLEIASSVIPATEVGGDYYDIFTGRGYVRVSIADVTGHGLESGVLMIMVQTAAKTLVEAGEDNPARFLDAVNRVVHANSERAGVDRNLTMCVLDYSDGRITLCGQHESVILIRKDGSAEIIDTMDLGFPLGILPDVSPYMKTLSLPFGEGDTAVLYTDGVTEAESGSGKELFGLDRLVETVRKNAPDGAVAARNAVITAVMDFVGSKNIYDDITLVVIRNTGAPGEESRVSVTGDFTAPPDSPDTVRLDFSAGDVKGAWGLCGAAADFIAARLEAAMKDSPDPDFVYSVRFSVSELMENAVKFSSGGSAGLVFSVSSGAASVWVSNDMDSAAVPALKNFLLRLSPASAAEMMAEAVKKNLESGSKSSGLGFLTMTGDHGVKFAWEFRNTDGGPVTRFTVMAKIERNSNIKQE